VIYELENEMPEIEWTMEELIQNGESEISFKHLGTSKNLDMTVSAEQLIFNDVLIFIIIQNTKEDYETTTPELDWEKQLEIEAVTKDLKNILGMATILKATSMQFDEVLMKVRINIPFAMKQTMHYCTFDFGHIWQFGKDKK
jgi:hypothetical protein